MSECKLDKYWIIKYKGGDRKAFKFIFDRFYSRVYYFCLGLVKSEYLAEEICQGVFIKLWNHRSMVDPEQSLEAFIFTIAKNQAINGLKKAERDQQLKNEITHHLPPSAREVDEDIISKEIQMIASKAISQLPKQRQEIFKMSREDGLSHQEIADKLGISKNTVKVQINRALNSIKEFLYANADISFIICLIFDMFP